MKLILYSLLVFLLSNSLMQMVVAQEIDSLQNRLNHTNITSDEKARIHLKLGELFLSSDPRQVLSEMKEVLSLKEVDSQYLIKTNGIIGQVYYLYGDYFKGLTYHQKRLEQSQYQKDTIQIIESMNDIAKGYFELEKNEEASNYWIQALYLAEKIRDESGIVDISLDLVQYYRSLGEYHIALNYLNRIKQEHRHVITPRTKGIINLEKGIIFLEQTQHDKALINCKLAYQIFKKLDQSPEFVQSLHYLGIIYGHLKDYDQSFYFFDKALKIAKIFRAKDIMSQIFESYATVYEQQGNAAYALFYYKKFKKYEERYYSEKRLKQLASMQLKYDIEQKEQEIIALKTEKLLQEQQIKNEKYLNLFLIVGVALLFALFGLTLFYAQFKHKAHNKLQTQNIHIQAQKEEIETQKESISVKNDLLEQTHQKITDSIRYAYTIQRAMLPHESELQAVIPDLFVSYMPKDIVSGDFYWATHIKDYMFLAVADCTGHGVPGGFMAMIGETVLDEIVHLLKIHNPCNMLEEMNLRVRSILKQDKKMNDDGMDIVICRLLLDKKAEKELMVSGAKRPLFYFNAPHDELQVVKGTNRSIGGAFREKRNKPFVNHTISIPQGGLIYLTTDGFVDQKGQEGIKYGSLRFKSLLRKIVRTPFPKQQKLFEDEFHRHQANVPQIDDVTVLGFKL